jgi:LysM repeat protein
MKRKFKMPNLLKFRRKKLRATAVRRPLRIGATTAEYGDLAEPSMKLSRALLIVLLLHVVAVAGIIAFNAIKTRQASLPSAPSQTTIGIVSADTKPQAPVSNPSAAPKNGTKTPAKVSESGKVYVVAKGDNPVTIAKKFKVSYDDLLALNHIDDPRRLKIGQKLLIPDKPSKKSP